LTNEKRRLEGDNTAMLAELEEARANLVSIKANLVSIKANLI